MELLSPAGNIEKLEYAWEYGADAVYIGLKNFSLRAKADNFCSDEYKHIARLKDEYKTKGIEKRLYCALNISFNNSDIKALLEQLEYFTSYPIDAFIIQDMGIIKIISKYFPHAHLHLSTQANCLNSEACKVYRDLGFSRIVLAREASLKDIEEIKKDAKGIEIECFVHGAMCIAYSGRCLVSAYLAKRSANKGLCTHSCRWNYKLYKKEAFEHEWACEEDERRGEYFEIEEGDAYTAMFSSKDLCMIDYLKTFRDIGVDAIKIEGRMKSLYYTAIATQAYRKKLDFLDGKISYDEAKLFIEELYNISNRVLGTGFYFDRDEADKTVSGRPSSPYRLVGLIGKKIADNEWELILRNKLTKNEELEYIGAGIKAIKDTTYSLLDLDTKENLEWSSQGHKTIIKTNIALEEGFIVRKKEMSL